MSDRQQPEPHDSWAPPSEDGVPPHRPDTGAARGLPPYGTSAHDQQTVGAGFAVPAPPPAPGHAVGPQGAYGTPYPQQPYGSQQYIPGGPAPYGPLPGGPGTQAGWPGQPNNGMGIAALVLGILSIVSSLTLLFGVITGVLGIIFGALGRARAKRGEATNGGMALAGLLCGVAGLLVSVLLIVALVVGLSEGSNTTPYDDYSDTYSAAPAAPGQ
ncbi:DUF4190 domain-containing protein [Streptomyces sp. NPDC050315]|uniref:DUF4190 domain-containing protein n=1 Tax=Streptomyces sp. NPDC050315 TaxID=3155039 RepID=UPI003438BD41